IQKIDRSEDASANRNLLSFQSQRITGSIVLFVMGSNDRYDRVGELHAFEDFRSDKRMNLHFLEFFRRQAAWFRNDMFGDRELSDVMQQGSGLQGLHFVMLDVEVLRDLNGIDAHSLQVIVSSLILGL